MRVMDYHRMSKDRLIGTSRLNLDNEADNASANKETRDENTTKDIKSSRLLELPVLTPDGAKVIGHNGKMTLIKVNVQYVGVCEPDPSEPSAAQAGAGQGESADTKKSSLFDAQEKPPPGTASVRKLTSAFETNSNPPTPVSSAVESTPRWLDEEASSSSRPSSGKNSQKAVI